MGSGKIAAGRTRNRLPNLRKVRPVLAGENRTVSADRYPACSALGRASISAAAALAIMLLAGCDSKPVVVAVDTICVSTSRPAITEAQRAAFRADQALWEPLVDWLAGFLKVRDGACLKPAAG